MCALRCRYPTATGTPCQVLLRIAQAVHRASRGSPELRSDPLATPHKTGPATTNAINRPQIHVRALHSILVCLSGRGAGAKRAARTAVGHRPLHVVDELQAVPRQSLRIPRCQMAPHPPPDPSSPRLVHCQRSCTTDIHQQQHRHPVGSLLRNVGHVSLVAPAAWPADPY